VLDQEHDLVGDRHQRPLGRAFDIGAQQMPRSSNAAAPRNTVRTRSEDAISTVVGPANAWLGWC
jgi:hypothetical protein